MYTWGLCDDGISVELTVSKFNDIDRGDTGTFGNSDIYTGNLIDPPREID